MAKTKTETDAAPSGVKVRVLTRCSWGGPDDVVTLTVGEAEQAVAAGEVDAHPDAVAYAESLRQQGAEAQTP